MSLTTSNRLRGGLARLIVAGLAMSSIALSSVADAAEDTSESQTKQQLKEIASKLQVIQTTVMRESKALQQQEQRLRRLIRATMIKLGKDPAKETPRLKQQYAELKKKRGSHEDVARKLAEFQQAQRALGQVRQQAMQDPQVKRAAAAFQKALEHAMIKKEPKAKAMLKRYDALRLELQALNKG